MDAWGAGFVKLSISDALIQTYFVCYSFYLNESVVSALFFVAFWPLLDSWTLARIEPWTLQLHGMRPNHPAARAPQGLTCNF